MQAHDAHNLLQYLESDKAGLSYSKEVEGGTSAATRYNLHSAFLGVGHMYDNGHGISL
jgi:hypothetical protein